MLGELGDHQAGADVRAVDGALGGTGQRLGLGGGKERGRVVFKAGDGVLGVAAIAVVAVRRNRDDAHRFGGHASVHVERDGEVGAGFGQDLPDERAGVNRIDAGEDGRRERRESVEAFEVVGDAGLRVEAETRLGRSVHLALADVVGIVTLRSEVDIFDLVEVDQGELRRSHCGQLQRNLPADRPDADDGNGVGKQCGGRDNVFVAPGAAVLGVGLCGDNLNRGFLAGRRCRRQGR